VLVGYAAQPALDVSLCLRIGLHQFRMSTLFADTVDGGTARRERRDPRTPAAPIYRLAPAAAHQLGACRINQGGCGSSVFERGHREGRARPEVVDI